MTEAAAAFTDCQTVIAGAPGLSPDLYRHYLGGRDVPVVFGQTYELLTHARAALVTSGTATLETALLGVPQVVCYYIAGGAVTRLLKRLVLSVRYISLVNLIAGREVVRELVADHMSVERVKAELSKIVGDGVHRQQMIDGYAEMSRRLGEPGAPARAAKIITGLLRK